MNWQNSTQPVVIIEIRPEDIVASGPGWIVAKGANWCSETGHEMNGNRKARIR